MSRKPVYGVLTFSRVKGGAAIDTPRAARDEPDALRLAERLAQGKVGAVAFFRTGDPDYGEFDQPVVIGQFGEVPYDLDQVFAT